MPQADQAFWLHDLSFMLCIYSRQEAAFAALKTVGAGMVLVSSPLPAVSLDDCAASSHMASDFGPAKLSHSGPASET